MNRPLKLPSSTRSATWLFLSVEARVFENKANREAIDHENRPQDSPAEDNDVDGKNGRDAPWISLQAQARKQPKKEPTSRLHAEHAPAAPCPLVQSCAGSMGPMTCRSQISYYYSTWGPGGRSVLAPCSSLTGYLGTCNAPPASGLHNSRLSISHMQPFGEQYPGTQASQFHDRPSSEMKQTTNWSQKGQPHGRYEMF